jgi:hypothetical protein
MLSSRTNSFWFFSIRQFFKSGTIISVDLFNSRETSPLMEKQHGLDEGRLFCIEGKNWINKVAFF